MLGVGLIKLTLGSIPSLNPINSLIKKTPYIYCHLTSCANLLKYLTWIAVKIQQLKKKIITVQQIPKKAFSFDFFLYCAAEDHL